MILIHNHNQEPGLLFTQNAFEYVLYTNNSSENRDIFQVSDISIVFTVGAGPATPSPSQKEYDNDNKMIIPTTMKR